ncbi:MAG: DUF2085 domain-containing protein [Candidatus Methanoplasma sp.]|jgi:uncharacterized membrane protein|nr:DUF2085 domain-containing protein [Candidatus Methanoplasma sp.]
MGLTMPEKSMLAFVATLLILMAVIPMAYPYGHFLHLDGSPGVIDGRIPDADPLSKAIYLLGDLLCHQQQDRSFIINGSEVAFCMRDTSFMAGVAAGLLILAFDKASSYIGKSRPTLVGAVLFATTFAEWTLEAALGIDVPEARIATGVVSGIGAAFLFRHKVEPMLFPTA